MNHYNICKNCPLFLKGLIPDKQAIGAVSICQDKEEIRVSIVTCPYLILNLSFKNDSDFKRFLNALIPNNKFKKVEDFAFHSVSKNKISTNVLRLLFEITDWRNLWEKCPYCFEHLVEF